MNAWEEETARLRELGLVARASMSGLTLWVPRTIVFAEAVTWLLLLSLLVTVPGCLIAPEDGVVVGGVTFFANAALIWAVGLGHIVTSQLRFLRRGLGQRLDISPHSVKTRRRAVPLEDIAHLELKKRVFLAWWLHAHLHDGSRVLLAFDDDVEKLRHLQALIDQRRAARAEQLTAEGHDTTVAARPPRALEALVGREG